MSVAMTLDFLDFNEHPAKPGCIALVETAGLPVPREARLMRPRLSDREHYQWSFTDRTIPNIGAAGSRYALLPRLNSQGGTGADSHEKGGGSDHDRR